MIKNPRAGKIFGAGVFDCSQNVEKAPLPHRERRFFNKKLLFRSNSLFTGIAIGTHHTGVHLSAGSAAGTDIHDLPSDPL